MMTFNELLVRYKDGTPSERQQVLALIPPSPDGVPTDFHRILWEYALRVVFEGEDECLFENQQ